MDRQQEGPAADRRQDGSSIFGSGLPAEIYRAFLNQAPVALRLPATEANPFAPRANVGSANPPGSVPG